MDENLRRRLLLALLRPAFGAAAPEPEDADDLLDAVDDAFADLRRALDRAVDPHAPDGLADAVPVAVRAVAAAVDALERGVRQPGALEVVLAAMPLAAQVGVLPGHPAQGMAGAVELIALLDALHRAGLGLEAAGWPEGSEAAVRGSARIDGTWQLLEPGVPVSGFGATPVTLHDATRAREGGALVDLARVGNLSAGSGGEVGDRVRRTPAKQVEALVELCRRIVRTADPSPEPGIWVARARSLARRVGAAAAALHGLPDPFETGPAGVGSEAGELAPNAAADAPVASGGRHWSREQAIRRLETVAAEFRRHEPQGFVAVAVDAVVARARLDLFRLLEEMIPDDRNRAEALQRLGLRAPDADNGD
jgi:hypothetical protein